MCIIFLASVEMYMANSTSYETPEFGGKKNQNVQDI